LAALTDILFLSAISANDGARARSCGVAPRVGIDIIFPKRREEAPGRLFSHENVSSNEKPRRPIRCRGAPGVEGAARRSAA
jgi:hypothetical protein